MAASAGPDKALKQLGRYELLEILGRGGMAEVYKARLPGALGFDKMVAVKRILPEARTNKEYVDMFVREARLCSRMMHPNLIQVFEFAETDGELFLAMELVEGSDLRKVITAHKQLGKALPLEFATLLAIGVLRGLDGAHRLTDERGRSLGVVHRDLSPANVLLSYEGAIKVADFGVAHQGGKGEDDGNTIKGKLQYMAPEQLLTGEVDGRVDVFAAGCVLYEMLSGAPVYPFGQTPEIIQRVARGAYAPVEQLVPGIDPDLAAIVRRSLAANRDERYPDCAAFANDITRLAQTGKVPMASSEDFGLYLQVLQPKQPFKVDLSFTPSAEDLSVPILTGTVHVDDEDVDLAIPEPAPLFGSLMDPEPSGPTPADTGPISGLMRPAATPPPPPPDTSPLAGLVKPTPNPAPSSRPMTMPPIDEAPLELARAPRGGLPQARPASKSNPVQARPASKGVPPARPSSSVSELDKMLRAYLDENEPAKKPAAPAQPAQKQAEPEPEKKKWLKWLK
ncbi:MAG: protein kinase [Deltaproteobacteria bacterium]|nr:protein kinase [Deltaproteobacteria bacterium]